MKRLGILLLALAGLAALLTSCGGGGEEAVTLAVAFRLDEGSPVMSAYMGDPAKDPFWLPTGRYYIEALDQDDVVVSLGAVDIEDGQAVSLPASLTAAGGVSDPERAQPLVTLANFLVDAELADYTLLEMVTGGFELPPFDPAVQLAAADVESLFGMYESILAQKDGVMAALDEVERRAELSLGVSYVRSQWGPVPQEPQEKLDKARKRVDLFFVPLAVVQRVKQEGADPEEALVSVIADAIEAGYFLEAQPAKPTDTVKGSPELADRKKEWREYAASLGPGLTAKDEAARQQAWRQAGQAMARDAEEWLKERGAGAQSDSWLSVLVWHGCLATAPSGAGWIEPYVQAIGEQWLDEGYGIEAVVAEESLSVCLTEAVKAGASREEAIAQCPARAFKPKVAPQPTGTPTVEETETPPSEETETPTAEETETPTVEETETPTAEATETPTAEPTEPPPPEPTETPTPEGQEVTANGVFTDLNPYAVVGDNKIWLKFSSRGGPVTGGSHLRYEQSMDYCGGTDSWEDTGDSFEGTYSPDTKELTGTAQWTYEYVLWSLEGEENTCVQQRTADTITVDWHATFENGVLIGSVYTYGFQLTVGGP